MWFLYVSLEFKNSTVKSSQLMFLNSIFVMVSLPKAGLGKPDPPDSAELIIQSNLNQYAQGTEQLYIST